MDKTIDIRIKLAFLWLFVLLNVIFRDIHQFTMKSHLEMLLTGYYNGMEVTDTIMFIGGMVLEIPISMVLFSVLLKRSILRPLTFVASFITLALFLVEPPSDPDDWFFKIVEVAGLLTIVLISWKWKPTAGDQ